MTFVLKKLPYVNRQLISTSRARYNAARYFSISKSRLGTGYASFSGSSVVTCLRSYTRREKL